MKKRIAAGSGPEWFLSVLQDARYAVRGLIRSPGFALASLVTLALGIGANTAIFSAAYAVLLRPLPYAEADRLVSIRMDPESSISKEGLVAMRERIQSVEALTAWSGWGFTLTGLERPVQVSGVRATADLFRVLGVRAALGRIWTEADGAPGAQPVLVLSHGTWQARFGADPDVVGSTLTMDGISHEIVGVMPSEFQFPAENAELWLPALLDPSDTNDYSAGYLQLMGRVSATASPARARQEMARIGVQLRDVLIRAPSDYGDRVEVVPLRTALVGDTGAALWVLLAAVGFVLLIACANVANLLLTRAAARDREFALRTALGAGRHRVVRQLLTESLVLAMLGGIAGLGVAWMGIQALGSAVPAGVPGAEAVGIRQPVLLFTLGVSLAAGVLLGLALALQGLGTSLQGRLSDGGRGTRGASHRQIFGSLLVAEVGLSVVLVTGAGLMIRSFRNLMEESPGYDPSNLATMEVFPSFTDYPTGEARRAYWDEVLDRIRAVPGVVSAASNHIPPFEGRNYNPGLFIEDRVLPDGEDPPQIDWRVVTHGYFETMDIPLVAGRAFSDDDRVDAPLVSIIDETLARRHFPEEDPIGRRIRTGFEGQNWTTIVGVVGDSKDLRLAGEPPPHMYRPNAQWTMVSMSVMVRSQDELPALARQLQEAVWTVDRNVPIGRVRSLQDVVVGSVSEPRLVMELLTGLGLLALLLAGVGIFGVMAYQVSQRTTEIGIRLALGAPRRGVLNAILGQALVWVGGGLALGLAVSLGLGRFLESRLYEVESSDPLTLASVVSVLGAVGLAASYLPARKASRLDPVVTLRQD